MVTVNKDDHNILDDVLGEVDDAHYTLGNLGVSMRQRANNIENTGIGNPLTAELRDDAFALDTARLSLELAMRVLRDIQDRYKRNR